MWIFGRTCKERINAPRTPSTCDSKAKRRRFLHGLCSCPREDVSMTEGAFESLRATAADVLERIPTRACLETAAVVGATLALSEIFAAALSTASIALLFLSAVV